MKKTELLIQTIIKFLAGIILMGMLIFLPAGTLKYWNAWLLMRLLFIPMFFVGIILFIKKSRAFRKKNK